MQSLTILADLKDYFPHPWLQGGGLVLLIIIIIGWVMYRRKQM